VAHALDELRAQYARAIGAVRAGAACDPATLPAALDTAVGELGSLAARIKAAHESPAPAEAIANDEDHSATDERLEFVHLLDELCTAIEALPADAARALVATMHGAGLMTTNKERF
jgi:hypothetical protein